MIANHIPKKKILLLAVDVILIFCAGLFAPVMRFGVFSIEFLLPNWDTLVTILLYISCFYLSDLYTFDLHLTSFRYLFRLISSYLAASIILLCLFFFLPTIRTGRGLFAIEAVLILCFAISWRFIFEHLFSKYFLRRRRIVIVGAGKLGFGIYRKIGDNPRIDIVGYIDDDEIKHHLENSPKVLGGHETILALAKSRKIDEAVVAIRNIRNADLFQSLLFCKLRGVRVVDVPSFYEDIFSRIEVSTVNDAWLINIQISGVEKSIYNDVFKRMIGITLSLFLLTATLPILIITMLAIKMDSPGPVFFKQKRVGLNGIAFKLFKFRSMRQNAEENGAVWATADDPRITRVGKIIRFLRIDEIPQALNVIKGEMNFFGPRPERPEFVALLEKKIPYYSLRHVVKPGISGWAQVNYPYGASEEDAVEKLKYDLYYIKNLSPFLDFHIFVRTIRVMIFGRGAR